MRKAKLFALLALIAVGLVGVYATAGYGSPSMTTSCQVCHSGAALTVTAVQTSNDGTDAVFSVSAPGASAIAVFDAAAKIAQVDAASGSVTVPAGKTYVVQAVAGPTDASGWGSTTISPAGSGGSVIPTSSPDGAAPDTVCGTMPAIIRGDATLHLVGTDVAGGWGMAYLYYKVDGSPARLVRVPANRWSGDVTVTVPAPTAGAALHTVKFWSQDNYGNVEPANTVTLTVNARTKMSMPIYVNHTSVYRNRPVTISGYVAKAGVKVVLYVKKPGATSWVAYRTLTASSARKWAYTYTPGLRGSYYFKARFAGDSEWLASSSTYKRVTVK